jgi:hypothetical protein
VKAGEKRQKVEGRRQRVEGGRRLSRKVSIKRTM